jgi:uncharacterized protein
VLFWLASCRTRDDVPMTLSDGRDAKGATGEDRARFSSVEGRLGRVVTGRLLPGTDLIRGLEEVCDKHALGYAAVVSAYGSLASAGFKVLEISSEARGRAVLVPKRVGRRVEFLAGEGLVCDDGEKGRATHLHGAVSDETGTVQGGHFEPDQNPVYNNLDFTLVELLGVRLSRVWEPETATVEMVVGPAEVPET